MEICSKVSPKWLELDGQLVRCHKVEEEEGVYVSRDAPADAKPSGERQGVSPT
jgi:hypothetical protein